MAEQEVASRAKKIKEGVQFILLLFGAGFGIYQFIYKDIYVPSKRPPAVNLASTLEELGRADGMILIRAHLTVANRGDAKVWVPALWWEVDGVSFSGEDRTVEQFAQTVRPLVERGDESFSRFSSMRQVEVAAAGRVREYEYWYQPKDETVHEQLFLVPEGKFDVLQIFVDAYIIKSIDDFAPTRWEMDKDGVLTPTLLVKQSGWDKDHPERVAPFEPETNAKQRKRSEREDAGHNSATASLRLKPRAATAANASTKQ